MKRRSGLTMLEDDPGDGVVIVRQGVYRVRLRMWLNKGEPVRWKAASGPVGKAWLEDDGATLVTEWRIDRHQLVSGLFYGCEGMRVGGRRRLRISPHLAYGEKGVPGVIPADAVLTAEIEVLEAIRPAPRSA